MRAFLLAAGRGTRFLPVTETLPKPLFPFLNVPIARFHLRQLRRQGFLEAGLNLHHLGEQIRSHLGDGAPDLPELTFFPEPEILGTAGALRNASAWLSEGDFLLINSDAAIEPDFASLVAFHRQSGRPVTLLTVENREPHRFTPLLSDGDRITSFGGEGGRPLLYTGICVMSGRLLSQIPPGETSLVSDLWRPLLSEGREEIGFRLHDGSFSDLGRPGDFLRASLEALERSSRLPPESGDFDRVRRVLSRVPIRELEISSSVLGRVSVAAGARIARSVLWDGVEVGAGAEINDCLVAGGVVQRGSRFARALLWPGRNGEATAHPLE